MWNNYAFGDGAVSYDWSTDHNVNEPGHPPSVTRPVFEVDSAGIKKLPIWKTIDNDDTTAVSMTIKHYSLPSLSPEVEDFYLKGTVNDTGIDVDIPFINADTLVSSILTTNNGVWDSRTDLINDTDWSDVFPIDVAANISRTVIQCFGDYRQVVETTEEEFWIGTITIDWVNDKVTGSIRSRINSGITDTNFYINETISELAGGVGTFTAHNDNGTTLAIAPQIHIVGRQIIALPVVDVADHSEMLANVDYHISHYKTIQTSSAESVSYDMTITKYNAGVHEYTPSENTTFFVVELVGGGGTSKRTVNGDGTSLRLANGGGGGYCKKKFNVADIESPATLTVGTSGNASTFEGMVAEAGEDSDVGVGYATGGDGGEASGGDVLLAGEAGSAIHVASNASTIFGGLAPFNISGAAGGCSLGNAGRGGAMSGSPATWPAINTANGYNGVAIITEYIRTTA